MADLTRFDFHAKRFYFSESVRTMTAEEVGEYLLLLVEAWMGSKDASLPDNPVLLARYARVPVVSELVLSRFPVVETEGGPRRRNQTLYEEWCKAVRRSEEGRASVAMRADRTTSGVTGTAVATYKPPSSVPNTPLLTQSIPSQTGSGPVRPGSNQSSPSQPTAQDGLVPSGADAPDPFKGGTPDFKTFRITWERIVNQSLSHSKNTVDRYSELCSQYGANMVQAALQEWATEKNLNWMKEHDIGNPFALFIKHIQKTVDTLVERRATDITVDPEMEEADKMVNNLPASTPAQLNKVEEEIMRLAVAEQNARDERARRFAEQNKPAMAEEGTAEDYISEAGK